MSLICSFQSDGLFHAVGSEELEQDFLVFPLHQYVGAEVFYGDSVYCYQVIACTDSFLVGRRPFADDSFEDSECVTWLRRDERSAAYLAVTNRDSLPAVRHKHELLSLSVDNQ